MSFQVRLFAKLLINQNLSLEIIIAEFDTVSETKVLGLFFQSFRKKFACKTHSDVELIQKFAQFSPRTGKLQKTDLLFSKSIRILKRNKIFSVRYSRQINGRPYHIKLMICSYIPLLNKHCQILQSTIRLTVESSV